MNDEDHAKAIRGAVDDLRKVLSEARKDGLIARLLLADDMAFGIGGRDKIGRFEVVNIKEIVRPL